MKCDERARLLHLFNKATLANSISIENMLHSPLQCPGGPSSVIYDIRRHRAGQARREFELARLAYDAHVSMHHCEQPGLSPKLPAKLTETVKCNADNWVEATQEYQHEIEALG